VTGGDAERRQRLQEVEHEGAADRAERQRGQPHGTRRLRPRRGRDEDQHEAERRQGRLEPHPRHVPGPPGQLDEAAEDDERRCRRGRDAADEQVAGEPVLRERVGREGGEDQHHRQQPCHGREIRAACRRSSVYARAVFPRRGAPCPTYR
jgi:hypothetical protein